MQDMLCQIMLNDSLRKVFRKEYPYERGLGIEPQLVEEEELTEGNPQEGFTFLNDLLKSLADFFEDLILFVTKVPVFVWVLLGIVVLAVLLVWMYRSGLFGSYRSLQEKALAEADNIYEIDFESEFDKAFRLADYGEALRLRYLRTLRFLADNGTVEWKIYKTPSQYAREAHNSDFNVMTRRFLWVRYGQYEANEAMYREVEALARNVEKGGEA